MGAINFSLQTITSGSMFRPGEYVWFGQPNQIPDPDNPATLKNPYIDAELTTTANAIQGIDSDSKCEQSTDGHLYGSGTYSIRVMSKADNTGVQRYYLPEVDLTPTESDLVRLTGNVVNFTSATGTVTIPDGLAIGTVYEVRKVNATQGAVNVNFSGLESITPASLTTITLNADGDFWRFRKTTATRWDLLDGHQTGSNSDGEWTLSANGNQICRVVETDNFTGSAVAGIYAAIIPDHSWPRSFISNPTTSIDCWNTTFTQYFWGGNTGATTSVYRGRVYSTGPISAVDIIYAVTGHGRWY